METMLVSQKRIGIRCPSVTKGTFRLKLLLFVSVGFHGTQNLSAKRTNEGKITLQFKGNGNEKFCHAVCSI
jgi:hypothetical protein